MKKYNKNISIIVKEAKKMNIVCIPQGYKNRLVELRYKNKEVFIYSNFTISNSFVDSATLAVKKDNTYIILEKNNLPVPKGLNIYSFEEAKNQVSKLPYPLVIKQSDGSFSNNVWVNIKTPQEALKIFKRAFNKFKNTKQYFIAQKFIKGTEFRVLVLDQEILAVLKLIPPYVTGDGHRSIKDLIKLKERKIKHPILINQEMIKHLKEEGYNLQSNPAKGTRVYIRGYSKLSEGGQVENISPSSLHPSIKEACVRATKAIKLRLGGIDLIAQDITAPIDTQEFKFLEINSRPDIYIHHEPNIGKPVNVARKILEYIFKDN